MNEYLVEYVDPNNNYIVVSRWISDEKLLDQLIKEGWKYRKSRYTTSPKQIVFRKLNQWLKRIGL